MQEITNRNILFVEDDAQLLAQMAEWFQNRGATVYTASTLQEAIAATANLHPDMIVLDVILPDGSGLDLLKVIRPVPPVIILSDLGNEENILDGFHSGAIDYIVKPCSMNILETRIRLRFLPPAHAKRSCCGLEIDSNKRTASFCGKMLTLTSSEFNILWFFINHPNRFFTSDEIYEHVWDAPSLQTTTIRRHLSTLRQKLKSATGETLIHTAFGKGYAFSPKGAEQ